MNREEQFNDGYELIYPSEDDIDECEAASQASIESDAQEAYFNDAHGPARRMLNHVSTDMRSMAEFIAHDATWGDASRASSWMSFEAKVSVVKNMTEGCGADQVIAVSSSV